MPFITSFYAGILGLIYFGLSLNVIKYRWKFRQSLGSGNQADLEKRIRVHGNFSEYVPLTLLMMSFLELGGHPAQQLHLFGCALIGGRILHALGINYIRPPNKFRIIGMSLTFMAMCGASLQLVIMSLEKGF